MKIEYDIKYEGNSNMQKLFDFEKRLLTEKPENVRKATVIYNPGLYNRDHHKQKDTFLKDKDLNRQVLDKRMNNLFFLRFCFLQF